MEQKSRRIAPKTVMILLLLLTIGYAIVIAIVNHQQQKGVPDGQFAFTVAELLIRILPGFLLLWLLKKSAVACQSRNVDMLCKVMMVLLGLWSVGLLLAGAFLPGIALYAHVGILGPV